MYDATTTKVTKKLQLKRRYASLARRRVERWYVVVVVVVVSVQAGVAHR
jgi:hypothetical protein